ncbi:MAG TPA: ABC-2 family transporter protein [Terriglobia bacterium]|nr:ABC-2 family transporter protein [Terriglobia bacterium]
MRYLRLYVHFLRFSFSRAMQFRLDFFFRIFMDLVWNLVNLGFFWVLYQHTRMLGGWSFDQMLVFLGGVFVYDAINMTVFSSNLWWLPIAVNRGDIDYHLVRPVPPLFMLSFREFAANSFVNLLVAMGILLWSLMRYPEPLGAAPIAIFLALLLVGVALHYALNMIFLIPVFWMHSAAGLREIFFSMEQYVTRPHGIFRGWFSRLLTTLLPFALVVSFPTRALFEGLTLGLLLHLLGVTAAAFAVMLAMWRAGLRAYSSASS